MSFIEPRINWTESDYFNAEDYNRIIGNLAFLKTFAEGLFETFDLQDMGEEKTYASLIYAREINIIESNLETINLNTYGFNLGEKTIYIQHCRHTGRAYQDWPLHLVGRKELGYK